MQLEEFEDLIIEYVKQGLMHGIYNPKQARSNASMTIIALGIMRERSREQKTSSLLPGSNFIQIQDSRDEKLAEELINTTTVDEMKNVAETNELTEFDVYAILNNTGKDKQKKLDNE